MSANFPDMGCLPDYPLVESYEDNVLRSSMEDGTVKTRPKYTRNRITYEVSYSHVPESQKEIFETFYRNTLRNGALACNWTHPASGEVKEVQFTEPPQMRLTVLHHWQISVKLREV
ncbi:hypothetical protein [Phascolarctobacterium sp.]|uniref:hypothetical protein n=1 Tax=Phascolarctobacterium sp. TaxID=2049039 RepID=UPI00386D28DE